MNNTCEKKGRLLKRAKDEAINIFCVALFSLGATLFSPQMGQPPPEIEEDVNISSSYPTPLRLLPLGMKNNQIDHQPPRINAQVYLEESRVYPSGDDCFGPECQQGSPDLLGLQEEGENLPLNPPPPIAPVDDNNNNNISDLVEECVNQDGNKGKERKTEGKEPEGPQKDCWTSHELEENIVLVPAKTKTEQELYSLESSLKSTPEFKNNSVEIDLLEELGIFVVKGHITPRQLDTLAKIVGPVHPSRISQVLFEEEQKQSKPAVEVSQGQIPRNFEVIGLPAAQAAGWDGSYIPIIIMDTGLYPKVAQAFGVENIVGYDAKNDKFCGEQGADCNDSFEGSAHNGHGSWVFAETKVIAPKSPIFPIKFINGIYTSDATTLRAINMILRNKGGPIVVNMSFEYPYGISPIADYAFRKLGERENIFPVAAGGNRSTNGCFEPAIYPFTLAVASGDVDPKIGNPTRWKTSAVCPEIDVAAPGHGFYATGPGPDYPPLYDNQGREVWLSGSSFAAPHFAGGFALILGQIRQLENPPQFSREDLFAFAINHMTQPIDPSRDPNIDRFIRYYGPHVLAVPNSLTGTGLLSFPQAVANFPSFLRSPQLGIIDVDLELSRAIENYILVSFYISSPNSRENSTWRRAVVPGGTPQLNVRIKHVRTTPIVDVDAQGSNGENYPVSPDSFPASNLPSGLHEETIEIDSSHPFHY